MGRKERMSLSDALQLSRAVKMFCATYGVTQEYLAGLLDLSPSDFTKILRGGRELTAPLRDMILSTLYEAEAKESIRVFKRVDFPVTRFAFRELHSADYLEEIYATSN